MITMIKEPGFKRAIAAQDRVREGNRHTYLFIHEAKDLGWTRIEIGHRTSRSRLIVWLDEHTVGRFSTDYGAISFEDPLEATFFQLMYEFN